MSEKSLELTENKQSRPQSSKPKPNTNQVSQFKPPQDETASQNKAKGIMERKPSAIKETSEKFAARMKEGTDSPVLQKILSQSKLKSKKDTESAKSVTRQVEEKPIEADQQSQGKDAKTTPPSTSKETSNKNRPRAET